MRSPLKSLLLGLCIITLLAACGRNPDSKTGKQLIVAAYNSSEQARENADFVCDGDNDQAEINRALDMLRAGGTVTLAAGDYTIGKADGYGGINIRRDNVTLMGQGPATRLHLADHQDCNVIRVYGVNNVTVRKLFIDANGNNQATLPPEEKNAYAYFRSFQFELSGIMVRRDHTNNLDREEYLDDHEPTNVVIDACHVKNARGLNIMLFGNYVKAVNNFIGDCDNDGIEVLIGPGEITGNTVVVTDNIGDAAIGTDKADNVTISNNFIIINDGAIAGYAIRTWHGHGQHIITNNQILIGKTATVTGAIDSRTFLSILNSNIVRNEGKSTWVSIAPGNLFTNNIIHNCKVGCAVSPFWETITNAKDRPDSEALIAQNILIDSSVVANAQARLQERDNIAVPLEILH